MSDALPRFRAPYDWSAIDHSVRTVGGAIVEEVLEPATVATVSADIDEYLASHDGAGDAASGSDLYDLFLGRQTIRLQGLLDKVPSTGELIGHSAVVNWAERLLADVAESILLNAGELIQIQPGEPAQFPHRDSDSWPAVPLGPSPVVANAIFALDDCTVSNGATYVAPGSWDWAPDRSPRDGEWVRAAMSTGDALLFRGDIVHGGGENASRERRRALSVSYCAGWLRPVENSFLNVSREQAARAPGRLQALLGYRAHDATERGGGLIGLYDNGDPAQALAN